MSPSQTFVWTYLLSKFCADHLDIFEIMQFAAKHLITAPRWIVNNLWMACKTATVPGIDVLAGGCVFDGLTCGWSAKQPQFLVLIVCW